MSGHKRCRTHTLVLVRNLVGVGYFAKCQSCGKYLRKTQIGGKYKDKVRGAVPRCN